MFSAQALCCLLADNEFSQDNFPDVFAALHQFVGFGGVFQGKTRRDDGLHLSAFYFANHAGLKVSFLPDFFVTILNFTEAIRGKFDKFFR
jgi:hypothetical protein